jgi:hypothetical protein
VVGGVSAEARVSDDSFGLRLVDNQLGQSRARVEYIWSHEIRSDSIAPLSALAANQSDEQVDSYYASDALVTVAAMVLAVILLGGRALLGSALRQRETWSKTWRKTWQAGRAEGLRAELMEFSKATSQISPPRFREAQASPRVRSAVRE